MKNLWNAGSNPIHKFKMSQKIGIFFAQSPNTIIDLELSESKLLFHSTQTRNPTTISALNEFQFHLNLHEFAFHLSVIEEKFNRRYSPGASEDDGAHRLASCVMVGWEICIFV